ncbi:MAG TPA: sulfite oxidase-like oxidoreductase [Pseudonocardiaceae bacterium]
MGSITRGFTGRRQHAQDRLPPGQYDVGTGFPVLTAEVTPELEPDRWTFTVEGQVAATRTLTWAQVQTLPRSTFRGDIHCVTAWSKLGTSFTGVSLDDLLAETPPLPAATHVLAWSHTGYTTNLEVADVVGGRAWVVWEHDGNRLPAEHGGPVRLLVPHRYFWKSAKWIAGLRFLDHDEPGFWERNGYHLRGDPWREERYAGD